MNKETPETGFTPAPAPSADVLPPAAEAPRTPLSWRLAIAGGIITLAVVAYLARSAIGLRGQALAGVFFFFGLVAVFSSNLRAVNWRTIGWGVALQLMLALLVLKVDAVRSGFEAAGDVMKKFISFSDEGSRFVFGNLSDARPPDAGGTWSRLFPGKDYMFQFAFIALPPILFISAFFTVLYHFGILQWCVRMMARVMVHLMGTSGAETLSVSANVFMGQTEAPLIVKPYVPRMTNSELFALMVSGMAHISGGMMVVYIMYGANPVAVLTTCVMACPCSLYLAKLFLPEISTPETSGKLHTHSEKSPYVNAIDAAASGTGDGLRLALNVAAMLIVFIAFVAMFDALLGGIKPMLLSLGVSQESLGGWPDDLSLRKVFGWIFSPAAFLMGVDVSDIREVGGLLGSKLAINEHFAYLQMKDMLKPDSVVHMSERSFVLTAFALTGFANFSSIGIQLGGIGALAPDRRHDLARLGARALFVGFTATLLNAAIAGVLL
jgi:CNT family concentrative nucleoside transporter